MHKIFRGFHAPANQHQKIWRFIDFTKYVDLLDKSCLYFSRLDKFDDPYEGVYPAADFPIKPLLEAGELARQFNFINCWHMNEFESAAMWNLYLKSNNGIAIQSTYTRLKDSFNDSSEDILLSTVKYHDFATKSYEDLVLENQWLTGSTPASTINPQTFKRKSFEHEHELRAIYIDLPIEYDIEKIKCRNLGEGKSIYVNMDTLVESIVIAPKADNWFKDLVSSVSKKYNLNKPVTKSTLYERNV